MELGNPLSALCSAIGAAIHRDFSDITYESHDWTRWNRMTLLQQAEAMKNGTVPSEKKTRRPNEWDIEVVMFPQTWGSTALGYDGIGGAAMTPAYTVIVMCHNEYCVYFGHDRLAYKIKLLQLTSTGMEKLLNDVHNQNMPSCSEFVGRYERKENT